MRNLLAVLILGVVLSGCTPRMIVKTGNLGEQNLDLLVRPSQSLGIQVTKAISSEKVTLLKIEFPGKLLSEDYPGRIRWNGWLVDDKGKEHFAQVVRAGMYTDGRLYGIAIIDGEVTEVGRGKMVILSSRLDLVSDLVGNVSKIRSGDFSNEQEYRAEVVKNFGSRIASCQLYEDSSIAAMKSYNRYRVKEFQEIEILTPYRKDDFTKIHKLNPSYGLMERIIAEGNIVISTNPVYTVASIGISVATAMNAETKGWDYMSELPNREMLATIQEYERLFYVKLIELLNNKINKQEESLKKSQTIVVLTDQVRAVKVSTKNDKKGARR